MKNIILIILVLHSFIGIGQTFKKSVITDLSKVEFPDDFNIKNNSIKKVINLNENSKKGNVVGYEHSKNLSSGEYYIFSNNSFALTAKVESEKNIRTVNKKVNGNVNKSINLSASGYVEIINEKGDFMYTPSSDGVADEVIFYNSNLEVISTLKPFQYGFQIPIYSIQHDYLVLATRENDASNELIVNLYKSGVLIKNKTIQNIGRTPVNICLGETQFVILSYENKSTSQIVKCFDYEINPVWEKSFENGIYGNQIFKDVKNNSILIMDINHIESLHLLNGKANWKCNITQNAECPVYLLEILPTFDNFVLCTSDVNQSDFTISKLKLRVQELSNGSTIYTEELGSALNEIDVIPIKNGFVIVQNDSLKRYDYVKK